jgi:abortive phage resistance protein AbiGi (putative antitoxin)
MAYISNHLTHFVGRSQESDQLRYDLLRKIVYDGRLLDPSHVGRRDPIFRVVNPGDATDGLEISSYPNVRHDLRSKLSDNALVQSEIVCFCDIPMEELAIHCSKYSHFGLAFSKSFLVAQGASPVMYIPKPGSFEMKLQEHRSASGKLDYEEQKNGDRAALIDAIFDFHNFLSHKRYLELQADFVAAESPEDVDKMVKSLRTTLFYQTALEAFVFGHFKFFDSTLSEDHIDNYYMEREWRVAGKVRFQPADIQRLFVAPEFAEPARLDFPTLGDRITVLPLERQAKVAVGPQTE